MQKTKRRDDYDSIHDRCAKIQNKMRGHSLSFGPPSSTINADGVGPAKHIMGSP